MASTWAGKTNHTLRGVVKRLEAELECSNGDFRQQKKMFDELLVKAAAMANALTKIAAPPSCGCVPCFGNCGLGSEEALAEVQDIAAKALRAAGVTE